MTLLHGFLGSPSDWEGFFPEFNPSAPDWLPALASLPPDFHPLKALAQSLQDSLPSDEEGTLIGYSMGGRIALHWLTLAHSQRWKRAIIISASPGISEAHEKEARLANDQKWAERLRNEPWANVMDAWQKLPVFEGDSPQPRLDQEPRREQWAKAIDLGSVGRQEDLTSLLPDIKIPVLWMAGSLDSKYRALARRCSELNPSFEFELIEGAGHRIPWAQPDAFQAAVRGFIKRTSP